MHNAISSTAISVGTQRAMLLVICILVSSSQFSVSYVCTCIVQYSVLKKFNQVMNYQYSQNYMYDYDVCGSQKYLDYDIEYRIEEESMCRNTQRWLDALDAATTATTSSYVLVVVLVLVKYQKLEVVLVVVVLLLLLIPPKI